MSGVAFAGLISIGSTGAGAIGGIIGFCVCVPILLVAIWLDKRKSGK